jgi:acetyltransferase-like isoleucine patch superfamily enzyme
VNTDRWSTIGITELAIPDTDTGCDEKSMRKTDFNSFEDPLMLVVRGMTKLRSIWISWTYPFISVGSDFSVHYSCNLPRASAPHIKIGNSVRLHRGVSLNVVGTPIGGEPVITIGNGCGITRRCVISAKNSIIIGPNTGIAPDALIKDHQDENVDDPNRESGIAKGGTIRIEEGCWIGFRVKIICTDGELVIGKNSVIGSNSVIRKSIPPYSVVAGNPAWVIKHFNPSTQKWVMGPPLKTNKVAS